MIVLLAPVLATIAAQEFAPPLEQPLRLSVSETRVESGRTLRFEIVRRVTFHGTSTGLTAEVETLSVTGDAGPAGRMFEAMTRAMIGRNVMLTLDRSGKVVDVTDLDATWEAQLSAIAAAIASKVPARVAFAEGLLAPLRSLPRAGKVARLGDMIAPLIGEAGVTPHTPRTITIPARTPNGTATLLPGSERVTIAPDGAFLLERDADGLVADAQTSVRQRRTIDPTTRLVRSSENVTTIDASGARLIVTRASRVTL